ncbi:hypothetical protein A2U01_0095939, partial [Trifolium medium]|nr:hypothetical protein [Trifolium medium]
MLSTLHAPSARQAAPSARQAAPSAAPRIQTPIRAHN